MPRPRCPRGRGCPEGLRRRRRRRSPLCQHWQTCQPGGGSLVITRWMLPRHWPVEPARRREAEVQGDEVGCAAEVAPAFGQSCRGRSCPPPAELPARLRWPRGTASRAAAGTGWHSQSSVRIQRGAIEVSSAARSDVPLMGTCASHQILPPSGGQECCIRGQGCWMVDVGRCVATRMSELTFPRS